jgi:hypothetical protein
MKDSEPPKRPHAERPPWLLGGSELCEVCGGRYIVEMELHCAACDCGMCMQCAVVIRQTWEAFCPSCEPEPI